MIAFPAPLDLTALAGPYRISSERCDGLLATLPADFVTDFTVDAGKTHDFWLTDLGQKLALGDDFGANFDALYDALCDDERLSAQTLLLVVRQPENLPEEEFDTLIAVLQACADEWREQGRALWALFVSNRLDLDPLPTR